MAATAYPDSSFLVSLLCQDPNSGKALACMARAKESLLFTPLHRIEARNALRNIAGRGAISGHDLRAAFLQIEEDLCEGILVHTIVKWTDVFRVADELSAKYGATDGQRTIDLLHVAIALDCRAKTFFSFDNRQRRLARAAGLTVKP